MPDGHGPPGGFAIECVADGGALRQILAFMDGVCTRLDASESERFDLKLAVEEACINVIDYGYSAGAPGPIGVEVRDEPDRRVVFVTDRATPFDPSSAPAADTTSELDDRDIGGLGLFLVRKVMNEVRYESSPERGNCLTLVQLKSRGQEEQ